MTEFQYENNDKLKKFADQFYGKIGEVQKVSGIDSVKVYKYLLAYCISYRENINLKACKCVEEMANDIDSGIQNQIFFEKAKMNVTIKDTIYFENYMKKMERDLGFLSEWYAYFAKVS